MDLRNDVPYQRKHAAAFDCAFISRYAVENERLFFGNHQRASIQSRLIVEDRQKLEPVMKFINGIDRMIHGCI